MGRSEVELGPRYSVGSGLGHEFCVWSIRRALYRHHTEPLDLLSLHWILKRVALGVAAERWAGGAADVPGFERPDWKGSR